MNNKTILNTKNINQITERIAYQIYEDFLNEDEVIVVGIKEKGSLLANKLMNEMSKLKKESSKISLVEATINKENPFANDISFSINKEGFLNKTIVLVDDVLNSGRTMMHVLAELTKCNCKVIRTVALIDRKHRNFPVRADFVGLSLSTTLEEHINVEFSGEEINVFLV